MKWKVLKFGIEYVDVNRLHLGIYTPHHPVLHEESRTIDGMIEATKNLQSILGWSDEQVAAYSENINRCSLVEVALSESPSPSLQEAADTSDDLLAQVLYSHCHNSPRSVGKGCNYEEYILANQIGQIVKDIKQVAGWNARDSQQTGPILTRELHDKIWEGAFIRTMYDEYGINEVVPDKETFYKSLNP